MDANDPADGWYIPSWGSYGSNENATSEATGAGGPATDGSSSLEVDDPNTNGGFAWEVGYQTFGGSEQNNGAAFLAQFDQAVTNNAGNYNLTFDVIYKSGRGYPGEPVERAISIYQRVNAVPVGQQRIGNPAARRKQLCIGAGR